MVDLLSTPRRGRSPSNFKRPRLSANRRRDWSPSNFKRPRLSANRWRDRSPSNFKRPRLSANRRRDRSPSNFKRPRLSANRRRDRYPSNFKRPRLSANRRYPTGCGTLISQSDPREVATYPTASTQKGVLVTRNFSAKKNACHNILRNKTPSDFKDNSDDFWIAVRDCKKSDAIETPKVDCTQSGGDKQELAGVPNEQYLEDFLNDKRRENLPSIASSDEEYGSADEYDLKAFLDLNGDGKGMVMTEKEQLKIDSNKVKKVINHFQEVRRKLPQQSGKNNMGISMQAAKILKEQGKCINMVRQLGPIMGIQVGDYFDSRVELSIIGLHVHYFCGIDYMEWNGRTVATSIVDSGRYNNFMESNDDQDFPDVLDYSGEGQNPNINKKAVGAQKLEKGNLALKNSSETKTPVRVIYKVPIRDSSSRKILCFKYVYDGLYFVDSHREDTSLGKLVFRFVLKRFPRQPKVTCLKLVRKVGVNDISKDDISEGKEHVCVNDISKDDICEGKEHVCVNDISEGKEIMPIRVVNELDNEKPPFFKYVTNVIYPSSYRPSMSTGSCNCSDGCLDFGDCPCIKKNGGQIPYNDEGRIMMVKPLIIECGPSCKCSSSCSNRVSQSKIRFQLEVFKTKSKGWGVRTLCFIPAGSFICEYTGEILGEKDAEQKVGNDEYLFRIASTRSSLHSSNVSECFTVDAARYGNVGRFINHSCSPNLFAQNVLIEDESSSMPHVMFFAWNDISPMKELTYDYNYRIGGVSDVRGNIERKACRCGFKECTGRYY